MRYKNIWLIALISSILSLTGCGGTSTDDTKEEQKTETTTSFVSGTIISASGALLQNVTVKSGTSQTSTNAQGEYTLSLPVGAGKSITADLENYTQNSHNVDLEQDINATLDMTLTTVDIVETFDVALAATLNTKGAEVIFSPNSIVKEDGSVHTGNVVASVSFNQVTSSIGRDAFPGDYMGVQTDGSSTVLQSFGFIDVTLKDENGNALKLDNSKSATLTYPLDPNISPVPADGDIIPLWYYDTTKGAWIEEGQATYNAANKTFTGTVTHFTTWNLDAKVARAEYSSCIEDKNGIKIPHASLIVSTPGWNRNFTNNDVDGKFQFINAPSGLPLSITAHLGDHASSTRVITLAAGETRNDTSCLAIDEEISNLFFEITGTLVNSVSDVIVDADVKLYVNGTYTESDTTAIDGSFGMGQFLRPESGIVTLVYTIGSAEYSQDIKLDDTKVFTNLGTIAVSFTQVLACVQPEHTDTGKNLFVDRPFSDTSYYFDDDGVIENTIYVPKDFQEHHLYAYITSLFTDSYIKTGHMTFSADSNIVDLRDTCIPLSDIAPFSINTTIGYTTSLSDRKLKVIYKMTADLDNPNRYGDTIIDDTQGESFNITKDGVYLIIQELDTCSSSIIDGTMSVTIDSVTHTLTIPSGSESFIAWIGFAIEVSNGVANVIIINKETDLSREG